MPGFAGMFANKTGCAAGRKTQERAAAQSQNARKQKAKRVRNGSGRVFGFLQETVLDACANQTSRIQQGYSSAAAVP